MMVSGGDAEGDEKKKIFSKINEAGPFNKRAVGFVSELLNCD